MTICWLITELSEHAESLPCRELSNSECDRISSVIEVNCQTPKELKRVDRKCDHYSYEQTVDCVKQWCGKSKSKFQSSANHFLADLQPSRFSANRPGRNVTNNTKVIVDTNRLANCGYSGYDNPCDACKTADDRGEGQLGGCGPCCPSGNGGKGSGSEQPNHNLYIMVIIKWIWDLLNN